MSEVYPPNSDPELKPKRKWTVLIYMAGDNNLSEECVYSLTQIKEALSDDDTKLAVLAQFDPAGVRAQTKRYKLRSKKNPLDCDATGWKAQETDTGEPHNLLEFVRWGISQYPADHIMVVLVGHGSGTDDDFLLRDDNPPGSLSILELRYVFEQLTADGYTIDILGMDTCLMNMAEVCFELVRTNITYMVGSEGFSPNTGWPYKEILQGVAADINAAKSDDSSKVSQPKELAKFIVEQYRKFYEPYINGGISVDQSVLEVKKIDEVKKRMFVLTGTLIDEFEKGYLNYGTKNQNAMLLAHWETQSYNGEVFVDLYDFCDRLAARYTEFQVTSDVIAQCGAVKDAISAMVVKSCVAGAAFQYSFGVSIYFPWAVLSQNYTNLGFPKESRWVDFLKAYHFKTRRLGRGLTDRKDESSGRASVPTNKGRDGHVESMRNPPTEEIKACAGVRALQPEPPTRATKANLKRGGKNRKGS